MKYLLLALVCLTANLLIQDLNFAGKYKMIYEDNFKSQNCIILVDGNGYVRQLTNRKIIGTITQDKGAIILKDSDSIYEMKIPKKYLENDTIKFKTYNLKGKQFKGDIEFYRGKLIKIRD